MSALADRIRGIVRPTASEGTTTPAQQITLESRIPNPQSLEMLGGERRDGCFVVERRWAPESRHGRDAIGTFGECLDAAAGAARMFSARARAPFVFFDLETTGLSGGAGTLAFLVGCGSFTSDGFVVRQFLLTGPGDERALLEHVHSELASAGAIVSFNGKSFDVPLLESRFAYHRLGRTLAEQPHVDVLHPARQFWPATVPGVDCSLTALERRLLGVRRKGDVDGFEVPARYFQFVRSGDARPLEQVLDHNRQDLLTLGALTARLFHVVRNGPDAARNAREAIALGRVYARCGDERGARAAFTRGVELAGLADDASAIIESLRGLAITLRRMREYVDAAGCWRRLIEMEECPAPVAREAAEALAIHHEHRVRDLDAARVFALRVLEVGAPRWAEGVRYRVARIDRKLSGRLL